MDQVVMSRSMLTRGTHASAAVDGSKLYMDTTQSPANQSSVRKMRIAYVVTTYPSSGDTFITSQVTGLIDRGHDVRIFALAREPGLSRLHEDVVSYDLLKRLEYHGKPGNRAQSLAALASDFLTSPVQSTSRLLASMKVHRIDEARAVADGYFKVRMYEKQEPFDVINPHYGPVANNNLFLKKMFPQSKYVASFHGYDFSSRIRFHGLDYYKRLFEEADLLTTQSFFSRDCLIALGCPKSKVIKHPNGVNIQKFEYRPRKLNRPDDDVNFIIVGRLVEKKGHRIILDAFEQLVEQKSNVFLHIVGSGPFREDLETQISQSANLRGKVHLHGWMSQDEVVALLDTSHIFIHPSITTMRWAEQEDTTTVLMEAQAMGLPVITTYHAGIPEVVMDGVSGLIVPERNEDALLAAMKEMVENPDWWEGMGKAGRTLVEQNFDIRLLSARLEWVFERLCSQSAGDTLGIKSTEQIAIEA